MFFGKHCNKDQNCTLNDKSQTDQLKEILITIMVTTHFKTLISKSKPLSEDIEQK